MKTNLKGPTGIDTSMLASKTDLAGLNSDDLRKLSNIVDNDDLRKLYMINWLSKLMLLILRYKVLGE